MKKTKILKIDFDRAVASGVWNPRTCLIAQMAMRVCKRTEVGHGSTTDIRFVGETLQFGPDGRELQVCFDYALQSLTRNVDGDLYLTKDEAESDLFFLRAALPIEIETEVVLS